MTDNKLPPEDQNTDVKLWKSEDELAEAQKATRQHVRPPKSKEELLEEYPTEFKKPDSLDAYIISVAGDEDAEEQVRERAGLEHDEKNPTDEVGHRANAEAKQKRVDANNQRSDNALAEAANEPVTEEVAVKESKYANAKGSFGTKMLFGTVILAGFLIMGATIFSLMSESDAVPWMYDYPYLAYLFAFIPISMTLVIAQPFEWIKCERCKNAYLALLFCLSVVASLAWYVTLGPAYAATNESSDLSQTAGFSIYPIHISIQLFGEVLIGALLKIGWMRKDRDTRDTEARETSASKQCSLALATIDALNEPLIAEITAINKHLNAHAAARQSFINECLAFLKSVQAEQAFAEARAEAIAEKAKFDHLSETKNDDE